MKKTNSMRNGEINSIEIDKNKVLEEISKSGQFQNDNIYIKQLEGEDSPEKYLSQMTLNNSKYIGPLNDSFQREGYGINISENGDKYFGCFENDKRTKTGVYFFAPEEKDNVIYTECYQGEWNDNVKEKSGIYIWLEQTNENETVKVDFDSFVGEIENDIYKRGTFLSKIGSDYYVYHGDFDREGKKNCEDAFFYSSKSDNLLHGKVSNDIFLSGYISFFDSNTNSIKDLVYATFDKEGKIVNVVNKEDLEKDEIEKEEKLMSLFRTTVFEVNYFGNIFTNYQNIKYYVDEYVSSFPIFEQKEELQKIIDYLDGYKSINIYNVIEEKIYNKSLD